MVKVKRQKEIVFSVVKPIFEKYNFKFKAGNPSMFIKKTNGVMYSISFDFSSKISSSFASNSMMSIYIDVVEDIISQVGLPGRKPDVTIKKEWIKTIVDKKNELEFNHGNPSHVFLETEEDFMKWANAIKKYINTRGIEFAVHYSYLPNILAEMDGLEKDGKYWSDILSGQVDNIFRGLIISKLCNDKDFERKLEKWKETIYSNPNLEEWFPYFDRLEKKLLDIIPKYNI